MSSSGNLAEPFAAPRLSYDIVCLDPQGNEKWRETIHNLVPTAGKNNIIDTYFKGSAYTASWFVGLKGTGTPVAADTAASHASWSEINPYSGTRPAVTWGTSSAGANTAALVSIAITSTATIAGAFLASVATVGSTSGVLYSVADFAAPRSAANGDTMNITPSVSIL
jgi:hypothetical protein